MVLNDQKKLLDLRYNIGMINTGEYEELRMDILTTISKLYINNMDLQMHEGDDLRLIAPQLSKINPSSFSKLSASKEFRTYKKDDVIFQATKPINGLFVIKKGMVEERVTNNQSSRYGMGSQCSYINVISQNGKALTTLRAVTKVEVYFIPIAVFTEIFESDIDFRNHCHF